MAKKAPKKSTVAKDFAKTGTVSKADMPAKTAELAKEPTLREEYRAIPANANPEGINKFAREMQAKDFQHFKDINTDEGYKKYVIPELERFNRDNPDIAIQPGQFKILQEYHKAKDPSVVVDDRFGIQTANLLYPPPKMASVNTSKIGNQGSQITDFNSMFETKTLPDYESGGGFSKGKTIYVEKGTGKIVDPSAHKFEGQYYGGVRQDKFQPGYTGQTYDELVKQGLDKSKAISNKPVVNVTGDLKSADFITTDPNVKTTMTTLPSGGDGVLEKNLQRGVTQPLDKTLPVTTQKTYKKGGLVGKIKGYERGGSTSDNSADIAAAVGAGLPYVAEGANLAILNKNNVDEYGRIDTGSKAGDYSAGIGSGALSGGAKGAQMGMAAGPYGALVGAGAGMILGGVKGGIQTKNDRASIEADKKAEEQAKREVEIARQKEVFNRSLQGELANRKTGYGYKKGGLVQKCADGGMIDYSSSAPFAGDLSRSEKKTISQYGIDPNNMTNEQAIGVRNAEYKANNNYGESTKFGLGGGGASFSAPTAMFKNGGYVKGPGTGTSDSVKAVIKPGSFIVPAKNAKVAEHIDHMMDMKKGMAEGGTMKKAPKKKVASLNEEDGEEVRLSNGEYKFTPEQKNEIIMELGEDVLESLAPDAEEGDEKAKGGLTSMKAKEILKDGTIHGKAISDKQKRYFGWIAGGGKVGMYKGGEVQGYKDGTKKKGTSKSTDPFAEADAQKKDSSSSTNKESQKRSAPKKKVQPESMTTRTEMLPVTDTENVELKQTVDTPIKFDEGASKKQGLKLTPSQIVDIGSGAANLANSLQANRFAKQQVAKGTEFLSQSGDRPVDQISPEFQDVLNKSQQEAKYGFSPQEQAVLDQQRLSGLAQQRQAARLYGLGYAGERQAINESFGRGLQSAIANKERMLQKQVAANQLAVQKADMSRRLFEDKMGAWQQEQKTGGDLIAAGLKNKIDANRYQNVLANLMANKAKESGYLNDFNFNANV
jgi:hypothetical protein